MCCLLSGQDLPPSIFIITPPHHHPILPPVSPPTLAEHTAAASLLAVQAGTLLQWQQRPLPLVSNLCEGCSDAVREE